MRVGAQVSSKHLTETHRATFQEPLLIPSGHCETFFFGGGEGLLVYIGHSDCDGYRLFVVKEPRMLFIVHSTEQNSLGSNSMVKCFMVER